MPVSRKEYYLLRCKAMNAVNRAVFNGTLKRAADFDCVDCGKRAAEYDHRDYYRLLDVVPVCRSCNKQRGSGYPHTYPAPRSKIVKKDRPIKVSKGKYSRQVGFRTTDAQYKLIERAAKRQGLKPGEFIRLAAVKSAKRVAK